MTVTGTVSSSAPPGAFFIQDLPPFFGLTSAETVKLTLGTLPQSASTNFDGVSDTCDAGIFSGSYEGSLNLGP